MTWVLVPMGEPVTLNACPPGPFEFNGSIGFRSEYATTLEEPRRYQVDAYCFESGEYFWGGASGTEARAQLVVQPLALSTLSADAIRQGEGKYLVWSNEHRAWWGPDHRGYTRVIERAGRYDRDEAFSIASKRGGGWEREANPDEIAIPEADAIAQYIGPRLATPASHASDGGEA